VASKQKVAVAGPRVAFAPTKRKMRAANGAGINTTCVTDGRGGVVGATSGTAVARKRTKGIRIDG
jgi:hypothetical protein